MASASITIKVQLYASLTIGRFKTAERQYVVGATVAQVVHDLEIPPHHLGITLINGSHCALDAELHDGDNLAIMPVLAGG